MVVSKTTSNSKKLKASKKKKINRWVVVVGVIAVAAIGLIVVRYSGASGEVWSARSSRVYHIGGQVVVKGNGTSYWVGTKLNDRIELNTPSSGSYCIKGSFNANGARATIYYYDSKGAFHNLDPVSGNKGQTFKACHSIPGSVGYTAAIYYSSGTSTAPVVVNGFEKQ